MNFIEALLDFDRVAAGREARAVRDAEDMRVDGDRRVAERDVHHDVRRLAARRRAALRSASRSRGTSPRCSSSSSCAARDDVLRLHVEQADRADVRREALDAELDDGGRRVRDGETAASVALFTPLSVACADKHDGHEQFETGDW